MSSTTYYWDEVNDNLFGEEDENGEVIASYTHEPGRYGELIAQERNGEIRYYNYDGLGNTSELTDEDGNVTDTYEYSAFGEEVARTGTTENPFGYKGALGYYTNGETNDIYVRARTYEPKIGRWRSRDPRGFGDGSNLFVYVMSNPLGLHDPSGLQIIPISFTKVINRCQFGANGIPGVEELRLDPIPQAWNPAMCEGCHSITCFDTEDGSPVDEKEWRKMEADIRAQIERKIETICNKNLQKRIKTEVKFAKSCGDLPPGFSITCGGFNNTVGPGRRFVIHMCVGMLGASRCDTTAIIDHELQHVEQYLRQFCLGTPLPGLQRVQSPHSMKNRGKRENFLRLSV